MRILVTGSRNWSNTNVIKKELQSFENERLKHYNCCKFDIELIHGNASGADKQAGFIASQWGWKVTPVPADWETFGKAAGPIRNRQMLDMQPDVVLGFCKKRSRGTMDCLTEAKLRNILVYAWDENGNLIEF